MRPFVPARPRGVARGLVAALTATLLASAFVAAPVAAAGTTITVNSLADTVADDGACTFREAVVAANEDSDPSGATAGECPAGSELDAIVFSVAGTITIGANLPVFSEAVTIDGGGDVTLDFGTTNSFLQIAGPGASAVSGLTLLGGTFGPSLQATGSIDISHVHISGKTWDGVGGGLYIVGPVSTVTDSVISGNSAGLGGGIYTSSTQTTILRSTVDGNQAINGGGGIFLGNEGTLTVDRSTVSGNSSSVAGGGGLATNGQSGQTIKLWNSTVAGNTTAASGGGILRNANLELVNTTIVGNTAATGGGVHTVGDTWTLVLKNSVLLGNTAGASPSDWSNGIAGELGGAVNSQIGLAGKAVTDWFTTATPADNGGPTKTLLPKQVAGNALIDGGDETTCGAAPISGIDQRGYGRASICDIGAVDVDKVKPTVSSVKTSLRTGVALSGTSSRATLSWKGTDAGSGVDRYTIQRRVDGGAWTTLATGVKTSSYNVTLASGREYAFRVRAIDNAGLVGSFTAGTAFTARTVQQTSSAFAYSSTGWKTVSRADHSGGSVRTSSTGGKAARFTATGRSYAWISTFGSTRGVARIYVDGVLDATVDLGKPTLYRAQAWAKTFSTSRSRVIRIVVVGSGERIDVDGFAVLR